jgi:hypothetical protein
MKFVFFLIIILSTGCTQYHIPIKTENHPAISNIKTFQIELSDILDISNSDNDKENKHED